jgi:CubicO group peptidase (beta-lactamase class C family)
MVMVESTGHPLTSEPQSKPPLDLDLLSETLSAATRKYRVPGAQLAIHLGGKTMAIEVGELEYGRGFPVTRDAAFPIGSITKTFTATVAMILVADGDLELDAALGEYLPELGDLGHEVTLRQVLSHTAGFAAEPASQQVPTASIRRYVLDHCRRENMVLPPGVGFSYSSIGYVLVGYLIESITGMTWWDAIESMLLRPLGIEPAFVNAPGRRLPARPVATGHSVNTTVGRIRPVGQSLLPADAPTGGLAVSAVDLLRLGLMHLGGGMPALLPTAYAEQMRQAVPGAEPCGSADGWGLGLAVFASGSAESVGHFGALDGTDCNLRLDPFGDCIVALTSNASPGGMWHEMVEELHKVGLPFMDWSCIEWSKHPMVPPLDCVGVYVNGNSELLVSVTETGSLGLAVNGGARQELVLFEDLSFSFRDRPAVRGRFMRDPVTGDVEQIQANLYAARRQPVAHENGRYTMEEQAVLVS